MTSLAISTISVAAGDIHRTLTKENIDHLKDIFTALPPGSDFVAQFYIVLDKPEAEYQGYHALTIHGLRPFDRRGIDVSVNIAEYADNHYRHFRNISDDRPDFRDLSGDESTLDLTSSGEVPISRFKIIDKYTACFLDGEEAASEFPVPTKIASSIVKIFRNGIALPTQDDLHYLTFTVAVRIPRERIQIFYLHWGTRGTGVRREEAIPGRHWGVVCRGYCEHPEYKMLEDTAKGRARARQLPPDAIQVTTSSARLLGRF